MNRSLGWTMSVLTMVAYSTITPIGKAAILAGLDPTQLMLGRYLIVVTISALVLLLRPGGLQIDRRGLLLCIAAGLANGLSMLAYFWGLTRFSGSVAIMLVSLYPLVVLIILAFRGEAFTRQSAGRLALGLGGVYMLIGPGGLLDTLGILFILASIVFYALYMVTIQWYLEGYAPWTATFYMLLASLLAVALFWLLQGGSWQSPGWQGWTAMLALALVGTLVSRLALFIAIQHIGGGQVALLAPLETFLAVFWAVLFLQERMAPLQWIGSGLIVASVLVALPRGRPLAWLPVKPRG